MEPAHVDQPFTEAREREWKKNKQEEVYQKVIRYFVITFISSVKLDRTETSETNPKLNNEDWWLLFWGIYLIVRTWNSSAVLEEKIKKTIFLDP